MLLLMRHLRILRLLLPDWHQKERSISKEIRAELLHSRLEKKRLKELDSIKGYRAVRYQAADQYLRKSYE